MYSLPSLAPQDVSFIQCLHITSDNTQSYTLWYTSTSTPHPHQNLSPSPSDPHAAQSQNNITSQPTRRHPPTRTPLSILKSDEEYLTHRLHNIRHYGSHWLKPPGLPKSLHQIREEQREAAEHAEALRREQLAQELAEAEAEELEDLNGEGEEGGEEGGEVVDLDDEIPDADETGGVEDEESTSEEEDEEDEENNTSLHDTSEGSMLRPILTSRLPDEAYRSALARNMPTLEPASRLEMEEEEEEDTSLLQEEDLLPSNPRPHPLTHSSHHQPLQNTLLHEDEDMDLDADIPDGSEEGGYEHTDTEAELSSSVEDDEDEEEEEDLRGVAASMVRSDGTQNSLDLSGINIGGQMSSSPRQPFGQRRATGGR